ncbi:MAG: divalent-cation tolerance protein CutA [Spirochaetota bacterium]
MLFSFTAFTGIKMELITVFCTVPDAQTAEKIAHAVVETKTAACASIVPGLVSVYRWKGDLCRAGELLLVMKTRAELFDALKAKILSLHPYELPEIVALAIIQGHEPYLSWIAESTLL